MSDTLPVEAKPKPTESSRIRAVKAELDRCASEYAAARDQFEKARVEFEIAREKLRGVRQLATTMLTREEWIAWKWAHLGIVHAGVPIGDAISFALWNHTWDEAYAVAKHGKTPYAPEMSLEQICHALESGGFDFRTTKPLREVNAALLQLKGIERLPSGRFKRVDAEEMLERKKEE